jgi:lipoprotein-releasing system permease protein
VKRFTVSAIFDSGMYEFDRGLALTHMKDAATLYRLGDRVTGLRLALKDPFLAPLVVRTVARAIDYDGKGYFVNDWTHDHTEFFQIDRAHEVDDVLHPADPRGGRRHQPGGDAGDDREREATDIAILRTIGAAPGQRAADVPGAGRAHRLVGTLAGALLGWVLALNVTETIHGIESVFGIKFLDASVYLMSDLPSEVRLGDVLQVSLTALALSALATIYPAWRASRTLPAEALRHE